MANHAEEYDAEWDAECYRDLAVELSDPSMGVDDFDMPFIKRAQRHALNNDLPFPPVPVTEGWQVTVISFTTEPTAKYGRERNT